MKKTWFAIALTAIALTAIALAACGKKEEPVAEPLPAPAVAPSLTAPAAQTEENKPLDAAAQPATPATPASETAAAR